MEAGLNYRCHHHGGGGGGSSSSEESRVGATGAGGGAGAGAAGLAGAPAAFAGPGVQTKSAGTSKLISATSFSWPAASTSRLELTDASEQFDESRRKNGEN